jgi:hypothetical protein
MYYVPTDRPTAAAGIGISGKGRAMSPEPTDEGRESASWMAETAVVERAGGARDEPAARKEF